MSEYIEIESNSNGNIEKKSNNSNQYEEDTQLNVAIKSKFEGVFEVEQSNNLLKEYKDLVNLCEKKIKEMKEFSLQNEEIKKIFDIDDNMIDSCEVNNEIYFFEISLNYNIQKNSDTKTIELRKTEYKFIYQENEYYCFVLKSMKDHLESLLKMHDFEIEILNIPPPKQIHSDIEFFLFSNYSYFKILISYQFQDINYDTFDFHKIYNKSDMLSGPELNLKLGHYVALSENEYKHFKYYNTIERNNFIENLNSILPIKRVVGLCGPYGTGKTITLLRLLIKKEINKFFYINLATMNKLYIDEQKKLLIYESLKLFNISIFSSIIGNKKQKEIFNNIKDLIDKFDGKNIFELLINIINKRKILTNMRAYFVIDQYSSKYKVDKFWIKKLIDSAGDNIHLIICSSMDNDNVKIDLCSSLNEKGVFPSFQSDFIFYFYVGSLIRLNNLENYEKIVENESQELIKYLKYLNDL